MGSPISIGNIFKNPGVAEGEFERDVALTMRTLLGRGFSDPAASLFVEDGKGFLGDARIDRPLPDWLSDTDLAYFTEAYQKSGFRGGLNWYRNIDRNWELTAPWQGARIHQPSLFIAGSSDSVITGLIGAKRVADMERVLPNLKQKLIIDGAGHWIQQERADEVNAALIAFLGECRLAAVFPTVIPARDEVASPESITTIGNMDFGPAPSGASRNDKN
jgi:pimeloyl-ACP methyl ester carboxylesterase